VDGSPLEILSDGTESYFYGSLYFDQVAMGRKVIQCRISSKSTF
jgi:hypothetical protein